MNKNKEKLIITDLDGVALYWNKAFTEYMYNIGYTPIENYDSQYSLGLRYGLSETKILEIVGEYNVSDYICYLDPYRDSLEYITKLKLEGFRFIAVTSLSDDPEAVKKRQYNLDNVYGNNIFDELHCLPIGSDKVCVLERFKDSGLFWIEDHYKNALTGANLGLTSILVDNTYNQKDDHDPRIQRVPNEAPWKNIYNIIKKEYTEDNR